MNNSNPYPIVPMGNEEYENLINELNYLAQNDWWFTFERRGVQLDIFNAFQKHRKGYFECMVSGPNQIYKSTSAQEILIDLLTRRNEYRDWNKSPKHILILTPKQTLQASGFQKTFQQYNAEYLKQNLQAKPTLKGSTGAWAGLTFKNGDHIQFETYDAGTEYIESVSADLVIMEEGNDQFEFYEYLTQRIIARQGVIYWSMIPGPRTSTVFTKIFGPAEAGKTYDFREVVAANKFHYAAIYGMKKVEAYEQTMSRRLYRIKICGEWIGGGNLVYQGFNPDEHIIESFDIPAHWRRDIFIDWANSDNEYQPDERRKSKTTATFITTPPPGEAVHLSTGRVVEANELEPIFFIYDEYVSDKRKPANVHAGNIGLKIKPDDRFQEIIIDCSIEEAVYQDFRKIFYLKGQGYRTYKATNKKRYSSEKLRHLLGHDLVEQIIDTNRLYIFRGCKNYINEILAYEIDIDKQQPQEFGDHQMDPQRYFFNRYPHWKDPDLLANSINVQNLFTRPKYSNPEMEYLSPIYRFSSGRRPPGGRSYR